MFKFSKFFSTKATSQTLPIPGSKQVLNSAGGYAWPVDDWTRLDRFLVLGSDGGTYYIAERELTVENAKAVTRCLAGDGPRVVQQAAHLAAALRRAASALSTKQ